MALMYLVCLAAFAPKAWTAAFIKISAWLYVRCSPFGSRALAKIALLCIKEVVVSKPK
jgi:hypothetical protein